MKGYIYVMSNKAFSKDLLKVGKSTRHPSSGRRNELFTTGVPSEFELQYWAYVTNCSDAEIKLHKKFADYRYSRRREFFVMPLSELLHTIKQTLGQKILEEGFSANAEHEFMRIAAAGVLKRYWDDGEVKELTVFTAYPDNYSITRYFKDIAD